MIWKEQSWIMKRYNITPRYHNEFQYEYFISGLEFGKVTVMTETELQNDTIQGLIQRNALSIQPHIESKKESKKEVKTEEPQTKKSSGKRALIQAEPVSPLEINEESN